MSKKFRKVLHSVRIRLHALAVLLIVALAGYAAVAYLVRSVFWPVPVPSRYLQWQGQLNAESLWLSDSATVNAETPRAPLGHYHGVDRWFQPDPFNGCAISECHSPMPHNKIAAVRAFDNFHASFLTCHLCHEYNSESRTPVVWVSLKTGKPIGSPAILKLMNFFELNYHQIEANPTQAHSTIVECSNYHGPGRFLLQTARQKTKTTGGKIYRSQTGQSGKKSNL